MSNDPTDELRELELLSRHLDGELSDEERAALQRRLDDEPALARQLEELRGVVDQLDALAPTEPPALDWEHLALPSSAAEVVRASPTPANRPWLWVAAVAAAAIALVASWPSPEELVLVQQRLLMAQQKQAELERDLDRARLRLDEERMAPIYAALDERMEAFGQQAGYHLIFAATSSGNLAYTSDAANVTDDLLAWIAQHPAPPTTVAKTAPSD